MYLGCVQQVSRECDLGCHILSAVLSEGVCKRQRGNAQWDSGKMAEMLGALLPLLLHSSARAGVCCVLP